MILNNIASNSLNLWMLSLKNGKDPNLFHKRGFALKGWSKVHSGDQSSLTRRCVWNCALL